ncbi:MAG: cell division protein FtsQ/DivIB [Gammaproteobacteria bacterium]|nr:cell division protein FtsQ/DivIB [Gammaproteobacteria bacterium]
MKQNNKLMRNGSGIHARPRVSIAARQPLKPKYSAHRTTILLGVLCISAGLAVQQNFNEIFGFVNRPITRVQMNEQWQQLNERDIRQLLQGTMGKGFFEVDVAKVKSAIEQHPWVARASVRRVWPDTLSMDITEHVAIARWGENQLLNLHGATFAPADLAGASHLPRLQGPEASQFQVMQQYQLFSQILFPAGLKLTELTLTARGSWQITLNDSLQVAIGRSDLTEKMERFVEFYISQPKTNAEAFEAIDLRYGNGIAVRNKQQDLTGVAIR